MHEMEDNNKVPRRQREKLVQRQEMLAAALELFSEKGYQVVTMYQIAAKAEFAIGTLYKFFSNKENLYKTLILEQAVRFHEALTKAIEEPEDEIEKLRNYVKVKGTIFRDNIAIVRLYFSETRGASFNIIAGLDSEIRERLGDFLQSLASIFENGMERKRFIRIADPYFLAVSLHSITNALLLLWLESPQRHPFPEDPDTILNILFKGLVDS
jgi:TetR/AcrR family transcriptional regulator